MTARNWNDLTTTWSMEKLETTRESIINKKVTAARRLGFKRKDIREREREKANYVSIALDFARHQNRIMKMQRTAITATTTTTMTTMATTVMR